MKIFSCADLDPVGSKSRRLISSSSGNSSFSNDSRRTVKEFFYIVCFVCFCHLSLQK